MVFGSLAKVDFCTQVFQIFALIAITHRVSAYLCAKVFLPVLLPLLVSTTDLSLDK